MHVLQVRRLLLTAAVLACATECANPANVFRSRSRLVREIRFTRMNFTINPAVGTIIESGVRPVRSKHMLFMRLNITRKITELHALYSISKCKDYYVDCETVVSYNITNGCSKLDVLKYYMIADRSVRKSCPFYGEYSYTNFTVNADEFGAMFSYPMEKWWELYWKINSKIYDQNYSKFSDSVIEFYFLEFRIPVP